MLSKARANGLSGDDIADIEEDLRSPCTQEIAVFRALAEIMENALLKAKASNEVEWINRIDQHTGGKFALIAWNADQIKGDKLLEL